ncbi:DUF2064 domain-containing protein [Conexibacter sp. W3-3-2]|uniref:DUF2064 domain-containing protein n=1 Tax=Conexibacter sp. W3-3-2 TaxID=2675227 RepID=UPI0012B77A2D|nr:DUF2064 domain-containing protein [Conexibacter sp. W3-3-2]MTD46546.1 DUF2064 domain-containing protein [Conexibacter sp. W3-3-2]
MSGVAAVVLYALAAPRDRGLDDLLGAPGATALREELALGARRWASRVSPDVAFEATTIGAASMALHDHDGPVLLVAPDVPRLDEALARAALADLEDGALVVMAPTADGTPYLVGVPRADPELLDRVGAPFEGFADDPALRDAGVGMLRSERRLVTPDDARAYAADPCAHEDLLRHLQPLLQFPGSAADR